ncbi:MAG TPA: coenzyme F420-0:L-glutamate ligase [Bacillota bacterium]|nr:coenzyme F420-0:L-glutamate ligase [Bacillota bacterium]HPZ22818.1 coenzyme F420-0:L-glutamate ligase [Bacillota bacterium]HQD19380.1 coenzyme F420-0:L-glutamate ligase [Bacillota bacterium]
MGEARGRGLAVGQTWQSEIESNGKRYLRILVKTHFITEGEDVAQVIVRYVEDIYQLGDCVVISETMVANAIGLAVDESQIKPGWWARRLYKYVKRTKHGRGIGTPEKMQVAIELAGLWRILLAAAVSAITKLFGLKGWFYRVAGDKVRSIDGQSGGPDGPYWTKVILPLPDPNKLARDISDACGYPVVIADINDLGGSIKGWSDPQLRQVDFADVLRDNPMGQTITMTPLALVRPVTE